MAKEVVTSEGSHVATRRGYAAGRIIEEGEDVPEGVTFAEEWMKPKE
jgi:hypothetical protein